MYTALTWLRMNPRTAAQVGAIFLAPLAVLLFHANSVYASSCVIEIDGELLRLEIAGVRQLVDPACFVRSSSSATAITIVDGRYLRRLLEIESTQPSRGFSTGLF
jgi:hypothetical protein